MPRKCKTRIMEAVGTIIPHMMQRTWAKLDNLHVTIGAHVEEYCFLN
jgi:hypothetical protein